MADPSFFRAWPGLGGLSPLELARRTWRKMGEHELITRASAAAYYSLTAFVPFLAVVITLAAHLAPDLSGRSGPAGAIGAMTVEQFRDALYRFLPREAYDVVAGEIARLQKQPPVGLLSVGLAVSLWLSSSLAGAIIDASNRIHGVVETRSYLSLTLLAIGLTVLQAAIMLGTLVALVVWPHLSSWVLGSRAGGPGEALIRWVMVGLGVLLSFDATLHLGPNVRRRWRWITPGSVLGTLVILASGLVLQWYVRVFGSYARTYGSLGGVLLLAFWFWIASIVMLLAVQINKIIEDEKGCNAS
jgi:membrane protein